ncbi:amidohydrolase [Embleya sp. NBC_00896]|uniref:amidohydrolase n=1 Tax=Embleya sp. NBC_00896 TaxID=2975961 RepID=UPI00386DE7B2|nr:amidohydrolase [Embleya sp. NBC_00896]
MTTTLFRGTIRTGAGDTTALAIRDGHVVALGADALALDADEIVELGDGLLLPAFGDGHAHPLFGGLEYFGPQVKGLASVEAIGAEVGRWAAAHPDEDWIVGASYDPTLVPDGEFDARWLDAAVADRPVVLRAYDYHTVWCNTEALRRAGITDATPQPRLGRVVRRPDGSAMGTLREWHACDLVLDRVPGRPVDELVEALRVAGSAFARAGVTWVQDAWVEPEMVTPYIEAARRGVLAFRANLAFRADPDRWLGQRAEFVAARARVVAEGGSLLSARTVKFFADGVIEGGTAAMLAPYCDAPHSCGMPVWPPAALAAAVTAFDADGFQVHIHAIGDAGVRAALDAIEAAAAVNPAWDRRPVIAHVQIVDPADLARFERLGVIANFEPLWAQLDPLQTELSIPRVGEKRGALQYPMRGLVDSGAPVSFGSDWPVSSHQPLEGIQVAVTRRTFEGTPDEGWIPHERLTMDQALDAYTSGVAYQAFADDRRVPAVGSPADLVWLSADPRTVDPMAVRQIAVEATWLGGQRTH